MELDLNINNYCIKDIESFFKLRGKYTASEVEINEVAIRQQLLASGHVDKRFVAELVEFTTLAKKWLIFVKCPTETPTSLPKITRLDEMNYPHSAVPPPRPIVEHPQTNFAYTQPSAYFQGSLNPLNTRTITKCLTIDTRFRDNYYGTQSSDFSIQLPVKLNKVVSMKLAAIELPISFYCISASNGNNYLRLKVEGEIQTIFTVPDGNYTVSELIYCINTLFLNAETPIFAYIHFVLDAGKIILESFGELAIQRIYLDFAGNDKPLSTKLGWNLGFQREHYSGTRIISDALMEDAFLKYIYFGVDDFQNNANNCFISIPNLQSNILARMSLTSNSAFVSNDRNIVSEPKTFFGPVDIQRLQFKLYDSHGRVLNMNSGNYSFCIKFETIYNL